MDKALVGSGCLLLQCCLPGVGVVESRYDRLLDQPPFYLALESGALTCLWQSCLGTVWRRDIKRKGDEDSIAVRDCDENWKQGNEQQKLYYCRDDADHGWKMDDHSMDGLSVIGQAPMGLAS